MNCVMIILNYKDCSRALALSEQCARYEAIGKIVIVDNASNDGSYEQLLLHKNEKTDVIGTKVNKGFASGNNVGAKYAVTTYHPDFLLFANTDTCFPEENVTACIKVLQENRNIGLVSTRMVGPDGKEQRAAYEWSTFRGYVRDYFWLGRKWYWKSLPQTYVYQDSVQYVGMVRGSFMCFRTQAMVEAGYFDENTFLYCEEVIIARRLKTAGYDVALLTDKSYVHDHIEEKDNDAIESMKRLYASRYYYATAYLKVNFLQRILMKILAFYSVLELRFIQLIKKWREGVCYEKGNIT